MKPRFHDTTVTIDLSGPNGNSFFTMKIVSDAMAESGHGKYVKEYQAESMKKDYNHLLETAEKYVKVIWEGK